MTGVDYESEYNNRARVPEHPQIIADWKRDAAAFRQTANSELDISYGPSPRATYDLFMPEASIDQAPAIALFIHGGYWQALEGKFFSHMAAGPVGHGFPVAVASYDLCPDVRIGDIVEEMRQLSEALWHRFRKPVIVYGHSAGGHLTAALLATNWQERNLPSLLVAGGMAISGLFDLAPLVSTSINDKLGLDPTEALAQSPASMEPPSGTRLIAAVGGAESAEYHRQSKLIVDAWGRGGVEAKLDIRGQDNHFTVIAPLANPSSDLTLELVRLVGQ